MVRIEQLSVSFGEFSLADISLEVRPREYFVVLGPTGAGKTVLLECVAGLTRPDTGRVWLGEREVTALPPEQRRVGYLPQDYALFPHMTVRENIGFGLMVRRRAAEIPTKIDRFAGLLGIGHLLDRLPFRLSGGEKQRVALARALAIDPEIMLLDEPLSALDVATRERISDELRQIHDATGITSLHICHNFDETLRLADRVALMQGGRLVQVGTPEEILRRPSCLFAAEFVRSENILAGEAASAGERVPIRVGSVVLRASVSAPGPVYVTFRPDDVAVTLDEGAGQAGGDGLPATVEEIEVRGDGYALRTCGALRLTAFVSRPQWRQLGLEPGSRVRLHLADGVVHAFADTGAAARDTGEPADCHTNPGETPP
jgi:ABC-type Fe3+/spermidine/putrescine transport system ATPase subunit